MSNKTAQTDNPPWNELDEERKILPIRPQLGGKEPPYEDWLSSLELGTIFLTRQRSRLTMWSLSEFKINGKSDKAVYLIANLPFTSSEGEWVDPVTFCQFYELYEILETEEEKR